GTGQSGPPHRFGNVIGRRRLSGGSAFLSNVVLEGIPAVFLERALDLLDLPRRETAADQQQNQAEEQLDECAGGLEDRRGEQTADDESADAENCRADADA